MKRVLYFVPVLLFFANLPAFATTIESVEGKVFINRGEGFQQATSGARANIGDRIMADAGSSAMVIYPGGCKVKVASGRIVSVGKQPPCTAPSLAGLEEVPPQETLFSNPLVPFGITATVGWGIFCATTYCRDDGGGRPASP